MIDLDNYIPLDDTPSSPKGYKGFDWLIYEHILGDNCSREIIIFQYSNN